MIAFTPCASILLAQNRTEVTINDTGVMPENLTSSQDGAVYFGSTAKGTIYRAAPGAAQAEPWILASAAGLTNVLGVLAFTRPDGLRSVGPQTLIQAEGQGRVTELTIKGDRAEVRVLQDGLTGATGVTVVGNSVLALVNRVKAVVVPYR